MHEKIIVLCLAGGSYVSDSSPTMC